MELAKNCIYCGTVFENWVGSKIRLHVSKHIERGDTPKEIPKPKGEPRWVKEQKLEKF